MDQRKADIQRKTRETKIQVSVNIDGHGEARVDTGIGFLNHMLILFARHGLFDLEVACSGDLQVDGHHSVEDIGICLGAAFDKALGEKAGIRRFSHAYFPMDEALVRAVVDLSGRPYLHYAVPTVRERVGEFDAELMEEFWRAFAVHARACLHLELLYGRNAHHIFEAVFKAAARAIRGATQVDSRTRGVPSTKGVL